LTIGEKALRIIGKSDYIIVDFKITPEASTKGCRQGRQYFSGKTSGQGISSRKMIAKCRMPRDK